MTEAARATLVTGAAGFLGTRLLRFLEGSRPVIGVDIRPPVGGVTAEWVQVTERRSLADIVDECAPERIVHCAFGNRSTSGVPDEKRLSELLAIDIPLYQAAARVGAKFLLVSSSAVYGAAEGRPVIDELWRKPVTLYGVAKAVQEMLVDHYGFSQGLRWCIVRLFNLCGPGQTAGTVLADWVAQAIRIARGGEPVLRVQNRSTSRDFVDVRDAASAIASVLDKFPTGGVFNIASGAR